MIYPEKLKRGDKVALFSPATTVKPEYVEGAVKFLRGYGLEPMLLEGVNGPADGSFAACEYQRKRDFESALREPDIKAVLCTRGGYGCIHLLAGKSPEDVSEVSPRWLIGFSDVSALHAMWQKSGVASIHGPMAKHLTLHPDDESSRALMRLLMEDTDMDYTVPPHPLNFNHYGVTRGVIRGGNLAVLNSLADTPYDILHVSEDEKVILFIEDISEAIYEVERMLTRMYLNGTLGRLEGLIVGQFTEYRPDRNYNSMYEMIEALLRRYELCNLIVAYDFPVGHTDRNLPIVEGAEVELYVSSAKVQLKTIHDGII